MSPRPALSGKRWVAAVLALAAAYFVAGKAGLLLAIPPGYATAVWPASGIALAALLLYGNRLWAGVMLGSFLVNLSKPMDGTSALLAAGVGLGAALQALAGSALVKRFAGFPDVLTRETHILRFLLLGGPVSCLVNATLSVTLLAVAGRLNTGVVLTNWWTWWVGDAIGVMIFTPLCVLWLLRPRLDWQRRVFVSLPLVVTCAVVVGLFVASSRSESRRIEDQFHHRADLLAQNMEENLNNHFQGLYAIEGFFAGSQRVEREEFRRFVQPLLNRYPNMLAFSWREYVPAARRAAFERALRKEISPDAQITEWDADRRMVRAANRPDYVPVTYVEPLVASWGAVGFDTASEPLRHAALLRARDTAELSGTEPVELVIGQTREIGFSVFLPIFANGSFRGAGAVPQGYVSGTFALRPTLSAWLSSPDAADIDVAVYDDAAPAEKRLMFGTDRGAGLLKKDVLVKVAGRLWRVHFTASQEYMVTHRSGQSWALLAGGLLFTGLLGLILLVVTGRTARVEEEVSLRTLELRRRQSEMEALLGEVSRANQDLTDFAHIVSHDLKAPLRGISALAHWIAEDNAEHMNAEGRERLEMLKGRVRKMSEMIDGILSYSRAGREAEVKDDVDLSSIVPAVVDMLAPPAGIRVELAPGLPLVRGNAMRLQQVFQNLIGNAIKYMGKPVGRVSVTFHEYAGQWRFAVEDDGPGIEERFFDKIFQIFQTVGLRDRTDSTGVGLSIVKKIVQAEGGKVWVESKMGFGSRFSFTWPRRPVCVGEVPAAAPAAVPISNI